MNQKVITLIGGTGFVGRYVVKLLAKQGYTIRVIARNPTAASHLKTAGEVGQIVLVQGNLARPETLEGKLAGSYAVVNLVGVLFESGKQNFAALHAQGAEKLAKMAKAAGVKKFIQISALGVDRSLAAKYSKTKALGEKAVIAAFPEATILRPGVIFGAEDQFFNKFAAMALISPVLPLIGGGKTLFQPVYVGDVAAAILAVLRDDAAQANIYELGGPERMSFKQVLDYILTVTGRRRCLLNVPFGLASAISLFMELLPTPPLTRDQVRLLQHDNVTSPNALQMTDLGITPTAVEAIVPEYLERYKKAGAQ